MELKIIFESAIDFKKVYNTLYHRAFFSCTDKKFHDLNELRKHIYRYHCKFEEEMKFEEESNPEEVKEVALNEVQNVTFLKNHSHLLFLYDLLFEREHDSLTTFLSLVYPARVIKLFVSYWMTRS